MEHLRCNGYQWVDAEVCMIWNIHHDKAERFAGPGRLQTIGTLTEALGYVGPNATEWLVILRLPAVVAYKVEQI